MPRTQHLALALVTALFLSPIWRFQWFPSGDNLSHLYNASLWTPDHRYFEFRLGWGLNIASEGALALRHYAPRPRPASGGLARIPGVRRLLGKRATPPNKGLHLTASSVRSCVAPASGSR